MTRSSDPAAVPALLLITTVLLGAPAVPGAGSQAYAQTDRTSTQYERRAAGEESLDVQVSFGAGQFVLGRAADGILYRAVLHYLDEHWDPVHRYESTALRVALEGGGGRHLLRQDDEPRMELRLSPTVPQNLEMEMGAVRAEMDLGGIALRSFELATGASDTRITAERMNPVDMEDLVLKVGAASLQADGLGYLNPRNISVEGGVGEVRLGLEGLTRDDIEIEVSLGLGTVELRIPEGVGIRLTRSSFLSSLHAPSLERRGDAHYSSDWESADQRVRIAVDSALGNVRIVRSDG